VQAVCDRSTSTAEVSNGRFIIERAGAKLPNMTSPDPLCPYRVIADSTGA